MCICASCQRLNDESQSKKQNAFVPLPRNIAIHLNSMNVLHVRPEPGSVVHFALEKYPRHLLLIPASHFFVSMSVCDHLFTWTAASECNTDTACEIVFRDNLTYFANMQQPLGEARHICFVGTRFRLAQLGYSPGFVQQCPRSTDGKPFQRQKATLSKTTALRLNRTPPKSHPSVARITRKFTTCEMPTGSPCS